MLKVILIDDEQNAIDALSQLLELYHPDIKLCRCCHNVASALQAIKEHEPDVLLLDVKLGQESSFDIFKHFPSPGFKVIFITAHRQYAVDAFRFDALDYLLKPVNSDHLSVALQRATDVIYREKMGLKIDTFLHNMEGTAKHKKIILKTTENIHLVYLDDIMYCEADRGYTSFYLADMSRVMVSTGIGEYEDLFHNYNFLRIHQSYLLNLHYFKRYEKGDGGKAILKNEVGLPVATRKKDQLLQKLVEL